MNTLGMVVTILAALGLIAWRRPRGAKDVADSPAKPASAEKPARFRRKGKQAEPTPEEAEAADSRVRERVERLRRHGFSTEGDEQPVAPLPAPAPIARSRPSPRIAETVSVVLRRQVPVRFDEPARSWLGGLPSLPDGVEWPRGTNREKPGSEPRPLHFLAQIACADLPGELWAGLGPREGWLLFFLNPNTGNVDDDNHFRVLHIREAGSERQPPEDIEPLNDGSYADYVFHHWFDRSALPRKWVRWPVDVIAVPNELREANGRMLAAPDNFAVELYDNAAVAPNTQQTPVVDPFSWRCLTQAWAALVAGLEAPVGDDTRLTDRLLELDSLEPLLEPIDAELDAMADLPSPGQEGIDSAESKRRQAALKYRDRLERDRDRLVDLLEQAGTPQVLAEFFAHQQAELPEWNARALEQLAPLAEHMAAVEPDSPLAPDDWQELKAFLKSIHRNEWQLEFARSGEGLGLARHKLTLLDQFEHGVAAMTHEVAAHYYTDPAHRHLLPDEVADMLEPFWRRLYENRPHRLGGYHDGVQSDAAEGQSDTPLLVQFASDEAMQWYWGEGGAIYAFIDTGALSRGEFWATQARLESR